RGGATPGISTRSARRLPCPRTPGPAPAMTEMVRSRADVVDWSARARRWTLVLLAAGVAWRLVRYGLGFPLWGDEAALLLNVVERHGYAELLRPLAHEQVAPLGFLAAEYTPR